MGDLSCYLQCEDLQPLFQLGNTKFFIDISKHKRMHILPATAFGLQKKYIGTNNYIVKFHF